MEFAVTVNLTTARPITEGQLVDLAELGGAAAGESGGTDTSVTMTVNAANASIAGDVAVREMRSVLIGASVDGVEVVTTAEQDLRLAP